MQIGLHVVTASYDLARLMRSLKERRVASPDRFALVQGDAKRSVPTCCIITSTRYIPRDIPMRRLRTTSHLLL